jgi:hypothetical protein
MSGIRDLISQVPGNGGVCVGFLADGGESDPTNAGTLQYSYGLAVDALLNKMWWGVAARFPGIGTPTALPYLGADRGIVQGYAESDASYAARLAAWLDDWQRAGSPRAVLQQVIGYIGAIRARTVDDSSNWYTYRPGDDPGLYGPSVRNPPSPANWNWDGDALDGHPVGLTAWWRWWLVLYSTSTSGASWAGDEGTWGDGDVWGDATKSWGLGVPTWVVQATRAIVKTWKRSGSWCRRIIVSLDDTLCVPSGTQDGTHNPDGTWGHWSTIVNRQYVAARPANGRYCDGVI